VLIRDTAFYARFLETGAKGGVGSGRKGAKAALLPPGEHLADGDEVFDIDADRDGRQRAVNVRVAARASPDERRARLTPELMERRRRRRDRPAEQAQIWTHEGNR
jgi:hypothetical protein